jgi:hypothetical protein
MIFKKILLLTIFLMLTISSMVNAKNFDGVSESQAEAIQKAIQLSGYKCDTVENVIPFNFSSGFTIFCNNFRYSYELADKGGRMVVTVK